MLLLVLISFVFGCSLCTQAAPVLGPVTIPVAGVNEGELLLGELNCTACHHADDATITRLFPRQSPGLGESGLRVTPQYLRAFLADPATERPGTTMPDLLSGAQRKEAVEVLVHFLISLNVSNNAEALSANSSLIGQGRTLYHRVGCVACHAPQESPAGLPPKGSASQEGETAAPGLEAFDVRSLEAGSVRLGNLAKKTTVGDLAQFLVNPLKTRPAGRMPSLNLTENEAGAIAMYLLREQAEATNVSPTLQPTRNLAYEYVEGDFTDTAHLEAAPAKASGTVERFSLTPRRRSDYFGLRFSGLIHIGAEGDYTFYNASDDGSRVYLDEKEVVENDGHHSTEEKKGTIHLKSGLHPIRLSYLNNDGGLALKVFYEGPGVSKQEIPAKALFHMGVPMVPLQEEHFTLDPEKARRGKDLFSSIGCAACHHLGSTALASTFKVEPLMDLDLKAEDGCLSANPKRGANYHLSDSQREALRSALAVRGNLAKPLAPKEQVSQTMAALNCFACHSRDNSGGPTPNRSDYFTVNGQADLGDEGRFPPHLTRVGNKLRPDWLREVLVNRGAVRPYMATRMPQFGEANVSRLAAAFEPADSPSEEKVALRQGDDVHRLQVAGYGRKLMGTEGLSCISCHMFGGYKSLGIPAMDLTTAPRRLKKEWFHRYLLEPASLRPGTRMPAFWPEGNSVRKDILGGDTERQIDALWAYLSLGKEGGLPPGLVQGKMELAATNETIVYRNFIQGAGSRAIGVGYPEKANLAFDANELRLALIWQGSFIDAARHRTGRGEGFEGPLGYNVLKFPAGPAFAALTNAESQWPRASGKKAGYQMHGYRLDSKGRPTFFYSLEDVRIEDYPVAVSGDLEPSLRRMLTLQTEHPVEKLWFRAWAGSKIETQSDGSFLAEGKVRLTFRSGSAKPIIRQSEGNSELLIPVAFSNNKATITEEIVW